VNAEAIERAGARYAVRVYVDKGSATDNLAAMWQWFRQRKLDPPAFRHSIRREAIAVQLDFDDLGDAAAFAEAFNGLVLGVRESD